MTWFSLPARSAARQAAGAGLAAALIACAPAADGTTAASVQSSPIEQMARLQPFIGAYATTMESGAQKTPGSIDVRPALGADYVDWEVTSDSSGMRLRMPMTWDPDLGRYRVWRFDTRGLLPPGENEGTGDLRLPSGAGPHPVAVLVHGGRVTR